MRRGFTLIELLVVIAIAAVVMSLLLPSLAGARLSARTAACATRLKGLGTGLQLYWNEFDRVLPQAKGPLPGGGESIIGSLFGGTKGTLPFYGIDTIGPARRPLNRYVLDFDPPPDETSKRIEVEAFRSPLDRGALNTGVPIPGFDATESMYELVGSSYALNDHAPDDNAQDQEVATLVPPQGGRMPEVIDTTRTWVIGTHTMYAFDDGVARRMFWFGGQEEKANVLFLDLHARIGAAVKEGKHSTGEYSFLPRPDWIETSPWRR